MIEPRWHQPCRRSDNIDDYDRLFIPRVHRLIKLGYDRLNPAKHATAEETEITGDLVEAIDAVLDNPVAPWMRFYCVHDDPPENQPMRKRRRRGRARKRVDIRLDSAEAAPRARLRFECKRLGKGNPVGDYLGSNGLGCFLSGEYARTDLRAGMVGYIQSDDEAAWAERIEHRLVSSPKAYSLRPESSWRQASIIDELPHTYRSGHGRSRGRRPIEMYHILLRFC